MSSIPVVLLILIHLHLLEYPLQHQTGYDEHLFNPATRGIGERTKAMEDITYFLVGRIEGHKANARSILPTYPCLLPSDTLAFRTSLAKYVESLRHRLIYPSHAGNKPQGVGKDKPAQQVDYASASTSWWWREVVVRKSLLEECAGDRFERLILALSTHALLQSIPHLASEFIDISTATGSLLSQPQAYFTLLTSSLAARSSWERFASFLNQTQLDLRLLRDRLTSPSKNSSSKYDNLSTVRLVAVKDSQYRDLLHSPWTGITGKHALDTLMELAGLRSSGDAAVALNKLLTSKENENADSIPVQAQTRSPAPLPIAAAHHPSHMMTLKNLVLSDMDSGAASAQKSGRLSLPEKASTQILRMRIHSDVQTQKELDNALAQLQHRSRAEARRRATTPKSLAAEDQAMWLHLWECETGLEHVDFTTVPTPELLSTFSMPVMSDEAKLQKRVEEIRSALPSFPALPSSTPSPPLVTRLPQLTAKLHSQRSVAVKPALKTGKNVGSTSTTSQSRPSHPHKISQAPKRADGGDHRSSRRTSRVASTVTRVKSRRSSVFPRRTTIDREVERVVDNTLDDSASFEYATPKRKPHSIPLSTMKKTGPRPTFDMDRFERANIVGLPQFGEELDEWTDEDDKDDVTQQKKEFDEENSITLRDILLKVGGSVIEGDLFAQEELADETFEW